MQLAANILVGNNKFAKGDNVFLVYNPKNSQSLESNFIKANEQKVNQTLEAAGEAYAASALAAGDTVIVKSH